MILGTGGENPKWQLVLDPSIHPYSSIFQVQGAERGTAWCVSEGVVATVGHVLKGASSCKLRISSKWVDAQRVSSSPWTDAMEGSLNELVFLQCKDVSSDPIDIERAGTPSRVLVVGFDPDGHLIEHEGPSRVVCTPFIAHSAHTTEGQSGGVMLSGLKAVGIHVGIRSIAKAPNGCQEKMRGFFNIGLQFSSSLVIPGKNT